MTEHITQNYQGMVQRAGGQSPTESELQPMRSGERWSLTATQRAYNAGGNEPGHMTAGSPQQEHQ